MTTIDLTLYPDLCARERIIAIPTNARMKNPAKVKEKLMGIGLWDVHPHNLFRISSYYEHKLIIREMK